MSLDLVADDYRSPKTFSLLAIAGFSVMSVMFAFSTVIALCQISFPEAAIEIDGVENSPWYIAQGIVYILRLPVLIFTIVFFLIWLNRANKNLTPLRAEQIEFSSGWAVGWWFIPFFNLVKPFQVVREVWWDSDPEINFEPTFLSASLKGAPTYMGVWWAFWIVANIFGNILERTYDPDTLDDVYFSGFFFAVSGILWVAAAVLAIMVVRDTTQRQGERHERLRAIRLSDLPQGFDQGR